MNTELTDSEKDPVFGLCNPYSKATCIVLYLYSMELGTPVLYADVNRVTRNMDFTYIKELGPFVRALNIISLRSESFKK